MSRICPPSHGTETISPCESKFSLIRKLKPVITAFSIMVIFSVIGFASCNNGTTCLQSSGGGSGSGGHGGGSGGGSTPGNLCAAGHLWSTWTPEASCIIAVTQTRTCTRSGCTESQTQIMPALGHMGVGGIPPTCTTDGDEGSGVCQRCGVTVAGGIIPALGHYLYPAIATCTTPAQCLRDSCNHSHKNPTNHGNYGLCAITGVCLGCGLPLSIWRQISARTNHNMAIRVDGSLWGWGGNANGQFGNGSTAGSNIPVRIGTDTNWKMVSAGNDHTMAIRTDGSLWGWGNQQRGRLGNGSDLNAVSNVLTPVRIGTDNNWKYISAGRIHSAAIRADGSLWVWGWNNSGQFGNNSTANSPVPVRVQYLLCPTLAWIGNLNWVSVSAGNEYTAAICSDGYLWTWGWNFAGQLGNSSNVNSNTPVRVSINGNYYTWTQVCTSFSTTNDGVHTAAIRSDGSLWTWGGNGNGQLGNGSNVNSNIPVRVGTDTNWMNVTAGNRFTIAIRNNGSLWSWGIGGSGQLGNNSSAGSNTPGQRGNDTNWLRVYAGGGHTVGFRTDGTVWVWGSNGSGQLGLGILDADRRVPTWLEHLGP